MSDEFRVWRAAVRFECVRGMTVFGRIAARGAARWPGLDSVGIADSESCSQDGRSQEGMPHFTEILASMAEMKSESSFHLHRR